MNALKYAVAAVSTTLAAMIIAAPNAHADSEDFLNDVTAAGWYNDTRGDAGLLSLGRSACRMLANGASGYETADAVYRNTGWTVDGDDAEDFVISAIQNLCPQYDDVLDAPTRPSSNSLV